jgi:hypothetical protein
MHVVFDILESSGLCICVLIFLFLKGAAEMNKFSLACQRYCSNEAIIQYYPS